MDEAEDVADAPANVGDLLAQKRVGKTEDPDDGTAPLVELPARIAEVEPVEKLDVDTGDRQIAAKAAIDTGRRMNWSLPSGNST